LEDRLKLPLTAIMSFFKTLFYRKKKAPLVCTVDLHDDPTHVHTDACFVDIKPLSIVELFGSQGCEACPAALPVIHEAAAANHNVLLLTYSVTYVSSPEFAAERRVLTHFGRPVEHQVRLG
jgi:hypothetical protein